MLSSTFDSTTSPTIQSPLSSSLVVIIISCFLGTGATLSNLLLLTAIYRDPYRNLRTASSFLLANLALCDFLVGFITGYGLFTYELCIYLTVRVPSYVASGVVLLSSVVIVSGVSTIVIMAVDRYLAVISPFKYAGTVTTQRVLFALLSTWIYTILINCVMFIVLPKSLGAFISTHLHLSLPGAVLLLTYIKMIREVQRQNKLWHNGRHVLSSTPEKSPTQPTSTFRVSSERERKLTSAILLIMISFVLCFLPLYVALNLQYSMSRRALSTWCYTLLEVSLLVVISHSMLNPIIYALRVPKYRRAVRKVLGLRDNIVNALISALGAMNTQGRGS